MRSVKRIVGDGKITIPKEIRDELDVSEGDVVTIDVRPVDR